MIIKQRSKGIRQWPIPFTTRRHLFTRTFIFLIILSLFIILLSALFSNSFSYVQFCPIRTEIGQNHHRNNRFFPQKAQPNVFSRNEQTSNHCYTLRYCVKDINPCRQLSGKLYSLHQNQFQCYFLGEQIWRRSRYLSGRDGILDSK